MYYSVGQDDEAEVRRGEEAKRQWRCCMESLFVGIESDVKYYSLVFVCVEQSIRRLRMSIHLEDDN
jgi:hypothetical protein